MNYAELKTIEAKLDMVLQYVVNIPSRELLTRDQIASNMDAIPYEKEITEILLKLYKDGYVHTQNDMGLGYFYSNFDGRIFIDSGGYKSKSLSDAADAEFQQRELDRLRNVDDLSGRNQTRLNRLTRWLVVGTIAAAVVGLVLLS
ncbi:hypothetical protein HDF24_15210 [Mucilaginibacter sp. X4EP1]|uniref:hypothetical protein n=1 Tax=Mucilaginibacter sp. X4EP1 TaxID=2723092 RepID=UPI0021686138|nr:hypothetical protein [Mucilaginibacter sp. X4EP1]MCS3815353.1 hypothetical protein [Mucilaginibacter sp. X4EP1]